MQTTSTVAFSLPIDQDTVLKVKLHFSLLNFVIFTMYHVKPLLKLLHLTWSLLFVISLSCHCQLQKLSCSILIIHLFYTTSTNELHIFKRELFVEEEEETNLLKAYNVKQSSKITHKKIIFHLQETTEHQRPVWVVSVVCRFIHCVVQIQRWPHKLATTEQKHWPHSGDERHPKRWFTKHGVYSKINYVLKERILCLSIC